MNERDDTMENSTEFFNQESAMFTFPVPQPINSEEHEIYSIEGSLAVASEYSLTKARMPGTTADGKPFDKATIDAVWKKSVPEHSFHYFHRDVCAATMMETEYGKQTRWGWVIDHIIPVTLGGTDDLDNLQALQWENNLAKGDNYPIWQGKQTIFDE